MNTITTQAESMARPLGSPWTIEDAAAFLGGISPRHLRRLIAEGKVKAVNLGRRVLIPDSEMIRVANEGTGN